MFASSHCGEVFKAVVKAISIDVVDNITIHQRAIGFLPDDSLFWIIFARPNVNLPVAVLLGGGAALPSRAAWASSVPDIAGPTACLNSMSHLSAINAGILPSKIAFLVRCGYLFRIGFSPTATLLSILCGMVKMVLFSLRSAFLGVLEVGTAALFSCSLRIGGAIAALVFSNPFGMGKHISATCCSLSGKAFFPVHKANIAEQVP